MKEMEINKPAIIARLKAYRERKGPDAYRILAHYVGKKSVSSYVLQSIANSAYRVPNDIWERTRHQPVPDLRQGVREVAQAEEVRCNKMRVIYKAPGGKPEIRDIPNTLEELQESVGGYIESCTFATNATVICNEEGRLRGLPYNCRFLGVDFVGPILVVGIEGDEFTDLDPETMGLLMRGMQGV